MFNLILNYPDYDDEIQIVKNTTSAYTVNLSKIMHGNEIIQFQHLIKRVPIADNVLEYAVKLVNKTRPDSSFATPNIKQYISYGAGPRAAQFLVIGAKCNAILNGKYSPDIEDVRKIASDVLRHRLIKNYKAEAEAVKIDELIKDLL